jgi:UDP:flavonoid glycosyltransferase YjiC (YdhE family)
MPDDDQGGRAGRIEKAGAGIAMRPFETEKLVAGLAALANPKRRKAMAAAARKLVPVNGAVVAAEAVVDWVRTHRPAVQPASTD